VPLEWKPCEQNASVQGYSLYSRRPFYVH
jgi:hypothetical protein